MRTIPSPAAQVRRIRADEWRELRRLRLEALADAPMAFETRFAEAAARPTASWVAQARSGAGDAERATFVAEVGGRAVGMCAVHGVGGVVPELLAVYVAPDHRGAGLVDAMVDVAVAFARDDLGAEELRLHVHEANDRAAAAYRRSGFVDTGHRRPSAAGGWHVEMVRRLGGGRAD